MSDGEAYHEARRRVNRQTPVLLQVLIEARARGERLTKDELSMRSGIKPHTLSARLSEIRLFGCDYAKEHVGNGVYVYWLTTLSLDGMLQAGRSPA